MSAHPFSLDGRVVLITGSSQGIGRALAQSCAEAGAHVIINARTPGAVERAVRELSADGLTASGRVADVTHPESVERLVESVEREIGPIAGLINNAGIQRRAPFLEFDLGDYRDLMEMNLISPFIVSQAVAKRMAERGSGRIVNIGSVQSQLGRPTIVPYTASKGGIVLLTRGMCADLGPLGIQVNCIAPGYFPTELTDAMMDEDSSGYGFITKRTPMRRPGRLPELDGALMLLASDASTYLTGQTVTVDGGWTMQ